jgi:hypothetical protein
MNQPSNIDPSQPSLACAFLRCKRCHGISNRELALKVGRCLCCGWHADLLEPIGDLHNKTCLQIEQK